MIKDQIYLNFINHAIKHKVVLCDNCSKILNAGPNYKPKFCDMCGQKISDNLDKVDWTNEEVSLLDWANYVLENEPDYIIMKIKKDSIKSPIIRFDEYIAPTVASDSIDSIINIINMNGLYDYTENDLEPASPKDLLDFCSHCHDTKLSPSHYYN